MADRDDEPGVLGNLPRSRPGRRSDKRTGGATAPKRPAAKPGATSSTASASPPRAQRAKRPATSPPRAQRAKRPATPPPRAQQRPRPQAQARPSGGGDPISQAVQIAGRVAAVGVKTAAGLIRRLPGR